MDRVGSYGSLFSEDHVFHSRNPSFTGVQHSSTNMSEAIHYRSATPADVRKLSILYKQVYIQTYGTDGVSDEFADFIMLQFAPERLEAIIIKHPAHIMVAEYRNNLVGVAEMEMEKRCPVNGFVAPELNRLYILEWFCGKGIGYHLLEMAEQRARSAGNNQMWLWVLDSNRRAVAFYERQGYAHIGNAAFKMAVHTYDNKVMLKQW